MFFSENSLKRKNNDSGSQRLEKKPFKTHCTENHVPNTKDTKAEPDFIPKPNLPGDLIVSKAINAGDKQTVLNKFETSFMINGSEKDLVLSKCETSINSLLLPCALNTKNQYIEKEETHESQSINSHSNQMVDEINERLFPKTTMDTQSYQGILEPISELRTGERSIKETCANKSEIGNPIKIAQEICKGFSSECNITPTKTLQTIDLEEQTSAKSQNEQNLSENCV